MKGAEVGSLDQKPRISQRHLESFQRSVTGYCPGCVGPGQMAARAAVKAMLQRTSFLEVKDKASGSPHVILVLGAIP